jgi:G3E family GTPase
MAQTRLILVGGFLGTGKTTLIQRAAQLLQQRGLRVGLVTNDQAGDIVDTALAQTNQLPVVEVSGGCFCCRFGDLQVAIAHLQQTIAPDVILAEPVGSCTDLAATVIRPLRTFHADTLQIAPLTILLDPQRDLQGFVAAVHYLHQRQLAEAELIVVTKADTLSPLALTAQQQVLQQLNQRKPKVCDWARREVLRQIAEHLGQPRGWPIVLGMRPRSYLDSLQPKSPAMSD